MSNATSFSPCLQGYVGCLPVVKQSSYLKFSMPKCLQEVGTAQAGLLPSLLSSWPPAQRPDLRARCEREHLWCFVRPALVPAEEESTSRLHGSGDLCSVPQDAYLHSSVSD